MNTIELIKNRLSIVDVVSDYVQLKKNNSLYTGLCPFHSDHKPSLVVNEKRNFCWCFVCNNGGDIFSFVQNIENMSFPEALSLLANKANVKLKDTDFEKEKDVLNLATQLFQKNINKAMPFLKERNIGIETINKFKIGFSCDLKKELFDKFTQEEIKKSGLLVNGNERFKERITFPLIDTSGTVIGFSGRTTVNNTPKYLNSAESSLFKKSKFLYGLNFAKKHILKNGLLRFVFWVVGETRFFLINHCIVQVKTTLNKI